MKNLLALITLTTVCCLTACAPESDPSGNAQESAVPRRPRTVVVVLPASSKGTETPHPTDPPATPISEALALELTPTPFLTPPPPGQSVSIPILMYHHLGILGGKPSQTLKDWTVAPERFYGQLDYVQAHGYQTINFAQLIAFFEKGASLPVHPIILTFDDGWMEDYTVAFPALHARGLVGSFFVPTLYADAGGKAFVTWKQIAEMDAAGMEFGGHTLNHADLKKADRAEALRQLQSSKVKLEQKLGHPISALSYPFGAVDAGVMALAGQVGYHAAVGLCCGYRLRADQLLFLPRIRISYDDTLDDFVKKLPSF